MSDGSTRKPLVLCILDGVGLRPEGPGHDRGNAVALARPACFESLFVDYPWTSLVCSGPAVGLPEGQMGNSEVGHLTIGSGRVIDQDLNRVSRVMAAGGLPEVPAWRDFVSAVRQKDGRLHLLGLVSPGGVHSHTEHLYGIVREARDAGIADICVHAFLDGRDTDPESGLRYLGELQAELDRLDAGRIVSVGGRYWGMDRDKRWARVEKAWRALVHGEGEKAGDAEQAVRDSYAAGITDEFVEPHVIVGADESPLAVIEDGDGVFFWNFRADRARELTWAFNKEDFDGFDRPLRPSVAYLCMTLYDENLDLPVLFPPRVHHGILADVLEANGLRNLRTAETEKYAHVTYFLNGGREEPFPGEDRRLVPSPQVATYDLQPEMSAPAVAAVVREAVAAGEHDLIVVNFANGDMVGHTGVLDAAVSAIKTLDGLLAGIVSDVLARGGAMLVTADHGNCEEMIDEGGRVLTNHTLNEVPLILVAEKFAGRNDVIAEGSFGLRDIAPTILDLMELAKPEQMNGRSVISGS